MSKVSKLVAILLIAGVVASGLGCWMFSSKPTNEILNYTSGETSLEVNRTTPPNRPSQLTPHHLQPLLPRPPYGSTYSHQISQLLRLAAEVSWCPAVR